MSVRPLVVGRTVAFAARAWPAGERTEGIEPTVLPGVFGNLAPPAVAPATPRHGGRQLPTPTSSG